MSLNQMLLPLLLLLPCLCCWPVVLHLYEYFSSFCSTLYVDQLCNGEQRSGQQSSPLHVSICSLCVCFKWRKTWETCVCVSWFSHTCGDIYSVLMETSCRSSFRGSGLSLELGFVVMWEVRKQKRVFVFIKCCFFPSWSSQRPKPKVLMRQNFIPEAVVKDRMRTVTEAEPGFITFWLYLMF